MTLNETAAKINSLQHLIGQKVPKWNSPILEMMPAPNNENFIDFIEVFFKTQDIRQAAQFNNANDFEILLIFCYFLCVLNAKIRNNFLCKLNGRWQ